MLLLAIFSTVAVILIYFSFFTAIIFSALCIILMFVLIYKKQSGVFVLCGILLLITVLSASFEVSEIERSEKLDGITVNGEFVALEKSESRGENLSLTVEVKNCRYLKPKDKLLIYHKGPQIEAGQSFKGKLVIRGLKDSDINLNYYSQQIYLTANLSEIVLSDDSDFVLKTVGSIKAYIQKAIFDGFGKDEAATMLALLTGDNSFFSNKFYGNVKEAGVAHVMVVSGMHLSIIVTFLTYLLNKVFYNRYLKAVVILITVITVFAVCGFTMSIMRAGITYILMSIAVALNRQSKGENLLGAAVSIILIFNPLAIFNVAFQLSVLSTFGILAAAIPITEFISRNKIIKSKAVLSGASAVIITISALIFTLPITVSVFGYISNMSVLSNLLISFPTTAALCFALAGLIVVPLRQPIFYVANLIVKYINYVINYCGSVDFATVTLPKFVIIIAVITIFFVICGLLACANQNNVLKLKSVINKKIKEGGGKHKWQSLMKKR